MTPIHTQIKKGVQVSQELELSEQQDVLTNNRVSTTTEIVLFVSMGTQLSSCSFMQKGHPIHQSIQ